MNFIRSNFFPYKNKYDLKKLAELLKHEILYNNYTKNFEIKEISSLSCLRDNSLLFLETNLKISEINKKNIHIITNIEENKNYYKNITIIKNLW